MTNTNDVMHTPGPWELTICRTMAHLYAVGDFFGISLPWKTDQDKANARLIADAPAAKLALELICAGVAEVSDGALGKQFIVNSLGEGILLSGKSWTQVIDCLSWSRCLQALAAARGGE